MNVEIANVGDSDDDNCDDDNCGDDNCEDDNDEESLVAMVGSRKV